MSEQERDRLIEQASLALRQAAVDGHLPTSRDPLPLRSLGEAMVKAGWRPSPTGDVIEQAWEIIANVRDACPRLKDDAASEDIVQALADAGLLRAPVEQDEDRWWESLTEAVTSDGCEHPATFVDSEDTPACPWCTIDRLHAPGEFMAISVPPPDELVERAAKAMFEEARADWPAPNKSWPDESDAGDWYRDLARAALRAAGEDR